MRGFPITGQSSTIRANGRLIYAISAPCPIRGGKYYAANVADSPLRVAAPFRLFGFKTMSLLIPIKVSRLGLWCFGALRRRRFLSGFPLRDFLRRVVGRVVIRAGLRFWFFRWLG